MMCDNIGLKSNKKTAYLKVILQKWQLKKKNIFHA